MQKHFATAEIKLAENSANVDFRFLQGTELLIRSSLWRVLVLSWPWTPPSTIIVMLFVYAKLNPTVRSKPTTIICARSAATL